MSKPFIASSVSKFGLLLNEAATALTIFDKDTNRKIQTIALNENELFNRFKHKLIVERYEPNNTSCKVLFVGCSFSFTTFNIFDTGS